MPDGYAVYDNDNGTWAPMRLAAYQSKGAATASFNADLDWVRDEHGLVIRDEAGRLQRTPKIQNQKRFVVKPVNFVAAE